MKSLLTYLLICVFAVSSAPAFAASATVVNGNGAEATTYVAKKKSEKLGFFGKVKNFGKKVTMVAKGLAGGEHNAAVAILLAFFLGGLGIHRVYLGGRPILILLYFITFGGIFGLLPLIDFIRLIIGHMDHYEGNDKFFAAFS